jgi:23S rRNA (uridine2552-2'-O)-methyltransferase
MSNYNRKDSFYIKAKEAGYRSRAAYKLLELNEKKKIFRPKAKVLELGSFPGGWLQIAALLVGPEGLVVGVDLKPIEPFRRNEFRKDVALRPPRALEGDVRSEEIQAELRKLGPFDVVLSDMSPKISGIAAKDTAGICELFRLALDTSQKVLKKNGIFVAKEFPSPEVDLIFEEYKSSFKKFERTRLKSTRSTSTELYVIGSGFLGNG